jgi:hypothetical protein
MKMKSTTSLLMATVTVLTLCLSFFTVPAFSALRVTNPTSPIKSQRNQDYTALYRLYNSQERRHLYTTSCEEKNSVTQIGSHIYEGIAGYVAVRQMRGTTPLYRLLLSSGGHFYTTNDAEMRSLTQNPANRLEATVGYLATSQTRNTQPFYRLAGVNRHFYTTNEAERNSYLQTAGNKDEGVTGYIWTFGMSPCDGNQPPVAGSFPIIYAQADFQGPSQAVERDFSGNKDWEGSPHRIRSIRVPQGWYLVLYDKRNFRGKSYNLNSDWTPQAGDYWNGRIKSIKVYQGTPPKQPR